MNTCYVLLAGHSYEQSHFLTIVDREPNEKEQKQICEYVDNNDDYIDAYPFEISNIENLDLYT